MTVRLHDSATREVRDLAPRRPGHVGIYLCGATVQGAPHIGHLRSAIAFDILVRWLRRSGLEVTLIRNVTDIDDKILVKSAEADVPWWAWAHRFEREFAAAYAALGVLPPTYEPRATGHVPEMIELIDRLIERGHAYRGEEGNVYFDVHSWGKYGALTRQLLENLSVDEDEASDKRDPRDFALWKATKPTDPDGAAWSTPWGRGRPGWHLECSAMARKYLGEGFDIHGGGIDLRFPHHENELAQSQAAGWDFTELWMHNAWVTVGGEKMSKSLGNSLTVDAVLERTSPVVLRYALGAVHYRSTLEFTDDTLAESSAAWDRISQFVTRAGELAGVVSGEDVASARLPEAFSAALDDDLNVSAALAVVHEHVRRGNTALASGEDATVATEAVAVRAMLSVLGLDPLAEPWAGEAAHDGGAHHALSVLVEAVLAERAEARAAKDYPRADLLRDRLAEAGIVVEDSAGGVRWSVKGGTRGR
ncbi:cysteine--tRNA ligase [Ruania alkalisoli]|uniref:Cysteine--tRNA ligase n=1 Tax=Ruania alkalisoli TaxID=2779775 RepID=A0A7M1SV37_9MICO|nr:cysteine--tRNA ligase [Ruania alkalisoli]QOR71439.1 cysteine--tRNA ligase [Ruania alkalisoli]